MIGTHLIVDEKVGLALEFVSYDCNSDLEQFKAKCNPSWGWDEAKMEEVFTEAMARINGTPTPVIGAKARKQAEQQP